MSEVNTSALRGSLEKCFAEQHDIANGSFEQWCFDQQQNDLKQLMVQYEDLEDRVELIECFYTRWDANQEENMCNVEKLENRVTKLEDHLRKLEDRVEIIDEGDDKRLDLLEERVAVLNTQNIELRDHLNLTIDMVNNVMRFLNNLLTNKEQVDEVDSTQSNEESSQLTVQQVYDMYQSQPRDEEGWAEMSKAIKAAEEYEAGLKEQQERVNGLTEDEWNDLLRI